MMEDRALENNGYIALNTYCDADVDYISWILLMNKKEKRVFVTGDGTKYH